MTVDLGIVQTLPHKDWLILALDKKLMKSNNEKSLEFQIKIDNDGKLILFGPRIIEPNRTGVNLDNN
ncbi:MAG: hypothetical protein KGI28_02280 [Thaumarchaeota archaeon]|nr:hypothetical protein [Nitrososphaerota archaeon]